MMRKLILISVLALLLVPFCFAARVGVIARLSDGSEQSWCVTVPSSSTAKDALDATSLTLSWQGSSLGYYLDSVNGVSGNSATGEYWSFWHQNSAGTAFEESTVGFSSYTVSSSGTVIGLSYSVYNSTTAQFTTPPSFDTYDEVCPSKLKITDIEASVDGDKDSSVDENGGTIDNVKPMSELELSIEVSNIFTDDEDLAIEAIEVSAVIDGIDDGDDLEEDADEFDLDADKEETVTITFEIPSKVEEGNYDLEISITGEDENNTEWEQTVELVVELDKDKHSVIIEKASLSPSTVKCGSSAELSLGLVDIGATDEEVDIKITSPSLGVSITDSADLEEGDSDDSEFEEEYSIRVNESQSPGTYPVDISLDYGSESEEESLNLIVEGCAQSKQPSSSDKSSSINTLLNQQPPKSSTGSSQAQAPVATYKESSSLFSRKWGVAIIAAEIAIVIIGALIVISLARRR